MLEFRRTFPKNDLRRKNETKIFLGSFKPPVELLIKTLLRPLAHPARLRLSHLFLLPVGGPRRLNQGSQDGLGRVFRDFERAIPNGNGYQIAAELERSALAHSR